MNCTRFWLPLLLLLATAPQAPEGLLAGECGSDFVLRAGKILPVARDMPPVIEGGLVVVRDGKIVAVGADLEVPADLPLIEEPDAVVESHNAVVVGGLAFA